jgi:hypothetical protein
LQVQGHLPQNLFPQLLSSSKCRNLQTVVSSDTGSQPKSMPTNCRTIADRTAPLPRWVRHVEPLLQKLNPQHPPRSYRRSPLPRLGIMWLGQRT